ncbi:MAG: hypothetical protein AMJ81_11930 [Phycisphaerae bacterium SM23_33]|nr:MAG: hypothetical protein AMJ81_11930 [Phycisphaerae bacterium SM23_33]
MKARHLSILRQLLSQPTAPFREEAVVEAVARWARQRGVTMGRDAAGNVLLEAVSGSRGSHPHWVFAAHMDHPGFVVRRRRGRVAWAEFRGSVARQYFPGSRVRLFGPKCEAVGRVVSARRVKDSPWLLCRLELAGAADVPAGAIGMWDLPALQIRRQRILSRACDDVVGSASVLCALEEILSRRLGARVTGLLTRAEEAAFIGCLAACRAGGIPRGAMIVVIEASRAQPVAGLGDGVVVRVGDKLRSYDPSLTAHVAAVAAALAKRDRHFRFTRQLMPGGTCEATAYAMFGYRATGLCLPLGHYHNQGPGGRIAAEQVHVNDFASLVRLLVAIAAERRTPAATDALLRRRFRELLRTRGRHL